MEQISPISSNNFKQEPKETAVELQRQPSFSSAEKKDEFITGKGPLLIAGTAGAIGGWFSATPLAKYFANKKIDSSIDKSIENLKDVKKLFFEDLSKEEFSNLYGKLQTIVEKNDDFNKKLLAKIPECLKKFGIGEEQVKFIEESIKKIPDFKIKLKPEQLEAFRLKLPEIRKIIKSKTDIEAFLRDSGISIDEEALNTIKEKSSKFFNNIETKSKDALAPLKDLIVDNYVKIPAKYKAVSAIVGGLSLAGITAIIKPSPKKS